MSWTSVSDIRAQLERRWKRGDVLRALVQPSSLFPLRIRLSIPTTHETATEYLRTQEWLAMLRGLTGTRLEVRKVRSRLLGTQQQVAGLWVDTPEDAVAHLQAQPAAESYRTLCTATTEVLPEILPWLYANPLKTLALEHSWERILRVLAWKKLNPTASPIYIRQADVPGVDTKFIEQNAVVLSELFNLLFPSDENDGSSSDFRKRFGFLREPTRIRFRVLDPDLNFAGLPGCPDVELDEDSFAALRITVHRVFVTENKTNVLAFPLVERAIVIFGAGYGMRALGRAKWMCEVPLYYWGDIDTHGFAILSQLREVFPHTSSFLMDETTFADHQNLWTNEANAARDTAELLTSHEAALFRKLQKGGVWQGLRLEQEKIRQALVKATLERILSRNATS